jgi:2-keto-4-pentenoate hydratase/2-oxohepta-3-ene-1,7-dioic acid hydratase in catechol pathway
MKVAYVKSNKPRPFPIISVDGNNWYRSDDIIPSYLKGVVEILCYERATEQIKEHLAKKSIVPIDLESIQKYLIPFKPKAYRDFMLFEQHAIDAARGFVKKYLPHLLPAIEQYEVENGEISQQLKPKQRWYDYPIYYLGNHLNFISDGDNVHIPTYTQELDYELELGVVICKPLRNACPEEAEKAIGGFTVFNDFSARDVQLSEMEAGFGPMKSKNFVNSISNVVVSADEILPIINDLQVSVTINGKKIAENTTTGMYHSITEAIAYASWEEQLHPGEFFGSGTVPRCTGIENGRFLKAGDIIELEILEIGTLKNQVV